VCYFVPVSSRYGTRVISNTLPLPLTAMASHRHTRPELSVIPDLRFEYSYLKSVGRYVHLERLAKDHSSSSRPSGNHPSEEKLLEDYENLELREPTPAAEEQSSVQPTSRPGELVHVQWGGVLWFTIRDQVIAPFLQGALWYDIHSLPHFAAPFLTTRAIGASRAITSLPCPAISDPN
jgi:hypothetical protein